VWVGGRGGGVIWLSTYVRMWGGGGVCVCVCVCVCLCVCVCVCVCAFVCDGYLHLGLNVLGVIRFSLVSKAWGLGFVRSV